MSGLFWALIFGVAYPLVALAVLSIAAFGISATLPELRQRTAERAKREWGGGFSNTYELRYQLSYYRCALAARWSLAVLAGIFWPIAVPLWFGWRKGSFIADALVKRDARDAAALRIVKDSERAS